VKGKVEQMVNLFIGLDDGMSSDHNLLWNKNNKLHFTTTDGQRSVRAAEAKRKIDMKILPFLLPTLLSP